MTPRNRIPFEQQRAVADFALVHATVNREQRTLQLDTRFASPNPSALAVPYAFC